MDFYQKKGVIGTEYNNDIQEHYIRFACDCENSNLTKRVVRKGVIQYVQQCVRCGSPTSNAIAKSKVYAMTNRQEPPNFNDELKANYQKEKSDDIQRIYNKYKNAQAELFKEFNIEGDTEQEQFASVYREHLKSDKWRKTRDKVLKRADYICEGCLENEANQVHHLTYQNVGDELLFQLVALCSECHEKSHH